MSFKCTSNRNISWMCWPYKLVKRGIRTTLTRKLSIKVMSRAFKTSMMLVPSITLVLIGRGATPTTKERPLS